MSIELCSSRERCGRHRALVDVTRLRTPEVEAELPLTGPKRDVQRRDEDIISEVAGQLFNAHAEDLLRYLTRRVGRPAAEDIVSEVFLVLLRGDGKLYTNEGGERAWLFGVATNLLRRYSREQVRALRAADRLASTGSAHAVDNDDELAERMDARRQVHGFVDELLALDPPDLDLLLLIAWGGLSPTEVATTLAIPAGTVRSRLHRIRQRLRNTPQNRTVRTQP